MSNSHFIIGTSGHVDHGKTSLIKALTQIDCDTHPEEKARGITINLGFSHINLPSGRELGIIDVPGHKDFIHTMIGGTGSMDIALLVVAADSGIMPQTVEHLNILRVLGIPKVIVALNKADLVDNDLIELATDDLLQLFSELGMEQPQVIPVSAITGVGLSNLINALDRTCETIQRRQSSQSFRMYIDRIFSVSGLGSVVTGSVLSGAITTGQLVHLLPSKLGRLKIKSIQRHGQNVEQAVMGDRAAINLSGIKKEDFKRGMLLCDKNQAVTALIDAEIEIFDTQSPIGVWSNAIFYSGTHESHVRIHLLNVDAVENAQKALVQIHLEKPTVLWYQDRFVLRNTSAERTIGGGMVIDAAPLHHRKRTAKLLSQIETLAQKIHSSDSNANRILTALAKERVPIHLKSLADALNESEVELSETIIQMHASLKTIQLDKELWISKIELIDEIKQLLISELSEHHHKYPIINEGLGTNYFSGKMAWNKTIALQRFLEQVLLDFSKEGLIRKVGATWVLASHQISINPAMQKNIDWLSQTFLNHALQKPVWTDIEEQAKMLKINKEDLKMTLKYLHVQGVLIKYQDEYIHQSIIEGVKKVVKSHLSENVQGINLSEFRQLTDCTKKIIPTLVGILEQQKYIKTHPDGTHTIMTLG